MTPGESQGGMKRHVAPLSVDTIGTSVGVALGKVISSGSENVVTSVFVRIVRAVTSTGTPPADQVVPAGAGNAVGLCGAIWTIRPSPGVVGTTVAGQLTVSFWSAVVSEPLAPGSAVFAVGRGSSPEPAVQTVKWVTKSLEVTPSLIVPWIV